MPKFQGDYYAATTPACEPARALQGVVDADTCIVGGGFAGLNTALGLSERGQGPGTVVLEAHRVGHGASGRNGGFVFAGFSLGEQELLAQLGPTDARALYGRTTQAVRLIRQRIDLYSIDCQPVDAGVIWANWFSDPTPLLQRQALLRDAYGADWQWLDRDELRERIVSNRYSAALFEPGAFHFHPLRYAQGIMRAAQSQGVVVHEQSAAVRLERRAGGWAVHTANGSVHARRVVLSCGGYLARLSPQVDASVLPIATYVMVSEPLGDRLHDVLRTHAAVYDTRFAFDYYRPLPDTRLLWGGRISVVDRAPERVEALLRRDMLKVFPQLDGIGIDYAWSGLMSYARHQMPHVLQPEPGLWVAQAFGGHGVAPTTAAGELLAAALAEGDTGWMTLSRYGLTSAFKPAGFAAAQASYWWTQARDGLKAAAQRSREH